MQALDFSQRSAPGVTTVGGIMTIKTLSQLQEEERAEATMANSEPVIQNLAGYIRHRWVLARTAKEMTVEPRMLKALRQRRGEYDPDMLAQLKEQNSSTIYMFLTSNKCRAASSWLRDVLLTGSDDKPWSLRPNPTPEMPPDVLAELMQRAQMQVQAMMQAGVNPDPAAVREILLNLRDQAMNSLSEAAEKSANRMEKKMHGQFLEGNWTTAFAHFLDDLVTFPSAFLKGPVVRQKPVLKWVQSQSGQYDLQVENKLVLEWERVDPFHIYPAPDASSIEDGYLIERHKMSRADLLELKGVEGYSDVAINQVLEEYGRGGLREWLYVDITKAVAEGKATVSIAQNPSEYIDALQFWGSVQGKLLLDWGMDDSEVPDPLAEYHIEAWLIGHWIIKAVISPDPLNRKPYYKASYEEIPGAFWGNAVTDLCRDTQSVCNAAARSLVNNMALASGPQVVYNIDRLPEGENLTHLYPWRIWQVTGDPTQSTQPPMMFYQPNSLANELLFVYEKFSIMADEYTGIPRYMTGGSPTGGAARTASGMNMLMSNAGKSIKQVIANIDEYVIKPCVDRLYYFNMRYSEDPELKGDVNIVARGAASLVEKEAAQQRTNEFLQVALNSPVAQQVMGIDGVSELLRQAVKILDMNVDKVVPSVEAMKLRQLAQMQAAVEQPQAEPQPPQAGNAPKPGGGQALMNGAPVTNRFQPQPT